MPSVKSANASSTGRLIVTDLRIAAISAVCSIFDSFLIAFCRLLERGERLVPEALEVRSELGQAVPVHAVEVPRSLAPLADEPGFPQHSKVLGDGRPADRQAAGELTDRLLSTSQPFEDCTTRRIGQRGNG